MTQLIGISGKANSGKDTVAGIIKDLSPHINWKIVKFADKLKDMVCILLSCTREQLEDREFKERELGEEWWYWKNKRDSTMIIPYAEELINNKLIMECYYLIKPTPRYILQLLGTDCGREIIHPNIWVNATFTNFSDKEEWFRKETGLTRTEYIIKNGHSDEYKTLNEQFFISLPNWIITDVRFPNEAKAIKDRNGILIRINRDITPDKIEVYEKKWKVSNSYKKQDVLLSSEKKLITPPEHLSETALDNYEDWDYVIENDGSIEDLINKIRQILEKCLQND